MSNIQFPQIDTSHWKTDDKAWMSDRKAHWKSIEPMLKDGILKSKKGLGIIKKYFLKGEMPDFRSLQDWSNIERHLDLFCFLWLHPEQDEFLLTNLRDAYVNSPLVLEDDVSLGFRILNHYGCIMASQPYEEDEIETILHTDGNNEMLFRVMYGDLNAKYIPENVQNDWKFKKPRTDLSSTLIGMTFWLCDDSVNFINDDCLYQYDSYLDYWYAYAPKNKDFFKGRKGKRKIPVCELALYRIHHFDTDKEGDTCRTRFVNKIRQILDERDFIPEFKALWINVKNEKTCISNDPWVR